MTTFDLSKYRITPLKVIQGELDHEAFLMRIAQEHFNAHGLQGRVCIGQARNEQECLVRDGLLLAYFFYERGGRNLIALFRSIYTAFDFIACKHLGRKLDIDWPEINRQYDALQASNKQP
jgi:hypothetical protein